MEPTPKNGYVAAVTRDGRSWGIYKTTDPNGKEPPAWWGGSLTEDNKPHKPGAWFWNATIATGNAIGLAQEWERADARREGRKTTQ